jgi:hypothetical protein
MRVSPAPLSPSDPPPPPLAACLPPPGRNVVADPDLESTVKDADVIMFCAPHQVTHAGARSKAIRMSEAALSQPRVSSWVLRCGARPLTARRAPRACRLAAWPFTIKHREPSGVCRDSPLVGPSHRRLHPTPSLPSPPLPSPSSPAPPQFLRGICKQLIGKVKPDAVAVSLTKVGCYRGFRACWGCYRGFRACWGCYRGFRACWGCRGMPAGPAKPGSQAVPPPASAAPRHRMVNSASRCGGPPPAEAMIARVLAGAPTPPPRACACAQTGHSSSAKWCEPRGEGRLPPLVSTCHDRASPLRYSRPVAAAGSPRAPLAPPHLHRHASSAIPI